MSPDRISTFAVSHGLSSSFRIIYRLKAAVAFGLDSLLNFILLSATIGMVLIVRTHSGPGCLRSQPTEIFEGVVYGCQQLQPSEEGRGFVHWVQVELAAPAIELYVTPKDQTAISRGWQYRLRWVSDVVSEERLAVAINGPLFRSDSILALPVPGEFANSVEPVIADGVVSHVWRDAYLLWFDNQLTPHLGRSKPIALPDLYKAKWGIGGQSLWLRDGEVWQGSYRQPDSQTAIAINGPRKLLFLATGNYISPRLIFQILSQLGAKDGMLLDGGTSSSMAIGVGAKRLEAGAVDRSFHPVATQFGIRANRVRD
jgi:hypothetical protein